jgi:galactonate dehydratase
MTKDAFEEDGGYILIPDRPGIGIELVEDITEKFPPAPRSISAQLAYDGSVYDV